MTSCQKRIIDAIGRRGLLLAILKNKLMGYVMQTHVAK